MSNIDAIFEALGNILEVLATGRIAVDQDGNRIFVVQDTDKFLKTMETGLDVINNFDKTGESNDIHSKTG